MSRLYPVSTTVRPVGTVFAETVYPTAWARATERPVLDLKRQQHTYPAMTPVDTKQLTLHENVLTDKWWRQAVEPVRDLQRKQYLSVSGQSPFPLGVNLDATTLTRTKIGTSSIAAVSAGTRFINICCGSAAETTEPQCPMPTAGTFSTLYVKMLTDPDSAGSSKGYLFTLRKAGVDTALAVTVLSSTTNFQAFNLSSNVHFAAGDLVSMTVAPVSAPANSPRFSTMLEFRPDTPNKTILLSSQPTTLSATAGFVSVAGDGVSGATENRQYTIFPTGGIVTAFYANLATVPGVGTTRTFQLDKNSVAVGPTITYGAAVNGVQNVATQIVIAAGDRLDVHSTVSGVPAVSVAGWGIVFEPFGGGYFVLPQASGTGTLATGSTTFNPMCSSAITPNATETNTQQVVSADFSLMGWTAWLDGAPGAGNYTISLRQNAGAAGTTYSTVMSTQGPTSSVSTSYAIVADFDLLDTQIVPASTPTARRITVSYLGYIQPTQSAPSQITGWLPHGADVIRLATSRIANFQASPDRINLTSAIITADMWHPEIQRPPRDLERRQYAYPFDFDSRTTTFPETIFADKWHPEIQRPIWGLKRQQYTYPSTFDWDQPAPSPTAFFADAWARLSERPTFDLKRLQYFYPWEFAPKTTTFPETVLLDKWFKEAERPRWDLDRRQYLWPAQDSGPHTNTFPENVLLDKWFREAAIPVWDLKRQQFSYPSTFDWDQPSPEVITVDKWWRLTERPVWDLKRQQYAYPSEFAPKTTTFNETIFADKWHPEIQRPVFDLSRRQWIYPSYAANISPISAGELITVDKWYRLIEQPNFDLGRRQYLWPSQDAGPHTNTFPETVLLDKWFREASIPVRDLLRIQFLYPSIGPEPILPIEITLLSKWFREASTPVRDLARLQYLYPSLFIDPNQLTQHENVLLDKWFNQTSVPVWDLKRQQFAYPAEFAPKTTAFAEIILVDKWYHLTEQPNFDLSRRQYLWPSQDTAPHTSVFPETVLLDKWFREAAIPVWDLKRQQWLYPPFTTSYVVSETITMDKWWRLTEKPTWDLKRLQYLYPTFIVDAKQLTAHENVLLDKWWRQASEPVRDLDRRQARYPAMSPIDTKQLTAHELVLMDKWFRQASEPVRMRTPLNTGLIWLVMPILPIPNKPGALRKRYMIVGIPVSENRPLSIDSGGGGTNESR